MATNLKLWEAISYAKGQDPTNELSPIASSNIKRAIWAVDKFLLKDPTMNIVGMPIFTLSTATTETTWGQDGSGNNNLVSADLTATDWETI